LTRFIYLWGGGAAARCITVGEGGKLCLLSDAPHLLPEGQQIGALVAHPSGKFLFAAAKVARSAWLGSVVWQFRVRGDGGLETLGRMQTRRPLALIRPDPTGRLVYAVAGFDGFDMTDSPPHGFTDDVLRFRVRPDGRWEALKSTRAGLIFNTARRDPAMRYLTFDPTGRYAFAYESAGGSDWIGRRLQVYHVRPDGKFMAAGEEQGEIVGMGGGRAATFAGDFGPTFIDRRGTLAVQNGAGPRVVLRRYRGKGRVGPLLSPPTIPAGPETPHRAASAWVQGVDPEGRFVYCGQESHHYARGVTERWATVYQILPGGRVRGPVLRVRDATVHPDPDGRFVYVHKRWDAPPTLTSYRVDRAAGTLRRVDAITVGTAELGNFVFAGGRGSAGA
jgi:hypothetical protein